ncbi:MOSC domain-containing protein [Roseobacter denitrificans]|uniref:MOSC domain protein n=1 Tax=Roseobacter denitrificans (strain ATCC 33942 / OCh 114) TaxID=375451 RepID=Q167Z1_ROSDO|nr:MOSC domain-containing protein [Roseobacter denitrificans]ABG31702.1 MOSC domain protein [Roseobacter denitrificans OCh 114]AVL51296.1 MOSC domain-containing protein [Roseobacter denitrificans]SFF88114.1 MOSC domain-containing protein [Roseobacter denitrificans OCh 114]
MPALMPTEFRGHVKWLGRVINTQETLRSETLQSAMLTFSGIEGECHGGLTRPACVRTEAQYPQGTEIRNVRQLSILSQEELDAIARDMGMPDIDPAWLGASMVIAGIPDFSHIPPSSRLQVQSGASIVVDMENRPCIYPGREIEKDRPGLGPKFKPAAKNRRGVTAWVEREGSVSVGDTLRLHIPDQPVWQMLGEARGQNPAF